MGYAGLWFLFTVILSILEMRCPEAKEVAQSQLYGSCVISSSVTYSSVAI